MGDATRFALGIAILLGGMIFFFFAFHPGGVEGVSNPVEMLKWLMNEINTAGVSSNAGSKTVEPTPTGAPQPSQIATALWQHSRTKACLSGTDYAVQDSQ